MKIRAVFAELRRFQVGHLYCTESEKKKISYAVVDICSLNQVGVEKDKSSQVFKLKLRLQSNW